MAASPSRVLVTGANGQLGTALRKRATKPANHLVATFTDFNELDITSDQQVDNFFQQNHFDYLVNCAAYTAVDRAEDEPERAFLINGHAPGLLAEACKSHGTKLFHISTDYVFDGMSNSPYHESSPVNPLSVYGKSKLMGENKVLESGVGMVIRTSWLYSTTGNNFVKTILRNASSKAQLNVVFDQVGTPTLADDLAAVLLQIIEKGDSSFRPEIFHYSNEGVCSWYDFAYEIVAIAGLPCRINPIETNDYPTRAIRPRYSVLSKEKIRNLLPIEIPYWRDSLKTFLKEML